MNDKHKPLFVERRTGADRRKDPDRCAGMEFDLYHRKRRRTKDRRALGRSLTEHIIAFYSAQETESEDTPVH